MTARLQVLPLPGPDGEHPFVLVFDRVEDSELLNPEALERLKDGIGACGTLVVGFELDV